MYGTKAMNEKRTRRARRVRARVRGIALRPRLSVFRSNRYLYAQLIDDGTGKTLAAASSHDTERKVMKTEAAARVGEAIAAAAKKVGVERAVLDRGSYRYHGRVRALVEAARKGGLQV